MRLKNIVLESRCAKTFGLWTPTSFLYWRNAAVNFVNNSVFSCKVLGSMAHSLDEVMNLSILRCSGRALRIPVDRIFGCTFFSEPCSGWDADWFSQSITAKIRKSLRNERVRIGPAWLQVFDPRDPPKRSLGLQVIQLSAAANGSFAFEAFSVLYACST